MTLYRVEAIETRSYTTWIDAPTEKDAADFATEELSYMDPEYEDMETTVIEIPALPAQYQGDIWVGGEDGHLIDADSYRNGER